MRRNITRAPASCDRELRAQHAQLLEQSIQALEAGIRALQEYQLLQDGQNEFEAYQQATRLRAAIGALEQYRQLAKNFGQINTPGPRLQ